MVHSTVEARLIRVSTRVHVREKEELLSTLMFVLEARVGNRS